MLLRPFLISNEQYTAKNDYDHKSRGRENTFTACSDASKNQRST